METETEGDRHSVYTAPYVYSATAPLKPHILIYIYIYVCVCFNGTPWYALATQPLLGKTACVHTHMHIHCPCVPAQKVIPAHRLSSYGRCPMQMPINHACVQRSRKPLPHTTRLQWLAVRMRRYKPIHQSSPAVLVHSYSWYLLAEVG